MPRFPGICSNLTRLHLAMLLPLSISDRAWNRYRRQGGLPLDRGMTINGTTELASFYQCRMWTYVGTSSSYLMESSSSAPTTSATPCFCIGGPQTGRQVGEVERLHLSSVTGSSCVRHAVGATTAWRYLMRASKL